MLYWQQPQPVYHTEALTVHLGPLCTEWCRNQPKNYIHLVWPHQPETPPGKRKSIDAGSIYYPLVELIPSINHSVWKKILTAVPWAPKLTSFLECPLIPLVLSARVKKTHSTLQHFTHLKNLDRSSNRSRSIVETLYQLSLRKVDAQSVTTWAVVGQLSW